MSNSKISQFNPASLPVPLRTSDLFLIARQGETQYLAPRGQDVVNLVASNITVTAANAIAGISAGTELQTTGTVSFANSNGLSFGLNAGTLTGSFSTAPAIQSISAGTTVATGPQIVFQNGGNVTFGANGNTITASAAGGGAGGVALSAGTQSVSTGTVAFADSNGISFGMSGSSQITASYTVPTVPAQISAGLSNIGNTSGNTGVVTGRLVFAGGNNVTLSGSTNAGSMTVTISAASQSAESNTAGMSNLGNSAGTSGVISGNQIRLLLAGGNNVTLSQSINGSSATITIVGPNPVGGAFSAGVSTGGNTAGATGVTGTQLVFVGSNNITLSQTTGANGGTVSIIGAAGGGGVALSAGTQSVSTGTVLFADSNGISFGMSGSSRITASYTVPPSFSAGVSTEGNTFGSTGITGTRIMFVGRQNISLSQSTNANGATIDFIGPYVAVIDSGNTSGNIPVEGNFVLVGGNNVTLSGVTDPTAPPENLNTVVISGPNMLSVGVSTGGNTAGNTGVRSDRVVFVGSNNITLSQTTGAAGATVSIIGAAGGAFSAGVSTGGNTSGATGVTGTRVVFAGTNLTMSQGTDANGATITVSGPSNGGITLAGNTSGALALISSGTMTLAGGNNITLSQNGNAVTVSAAAQTVLTKSVWVAWGDNGQPFSPQTHNVDRIQFAQVSIRDFVTATRGNILLSVSMSTSSNSSHAGAISGSVVLYSRNGSTLSSITSGAGSYSWSNTSNNSTSNVAGMRVLSFAMNLSLTPGEYYFGWLLRTATTNADWFTASFFNGYVANSGVQGLFGAAVNSSNQFPLGVGFLSATSAGSIASVAMSNIGMSDSVLRMPLLYFGNFTL